MKKYLIIIPFYNEYINLKKLIIKLKKYKDQCLFVDDGSVDNGFKLLNDFLLIKNNNNIGYHKSIVRGLEYAYKNNYEYAITFDADGQHNTLDLDRIITNINKNKFDIILTNRSKYNRLIEHMINYYFKSRFNANDILSGLKAYRLNKIDFNSLFFKVDTSGIGLALFFLNNRLKHHEFNISISKREDISTFGGFFKGNWRLFQSFLKTIFI